MKNYIEDKINETFKQIINESKLIGNEPMLDNETIEDYFNRIAKKLVWGTEKFKKDKELHTNGTPEEKKEKYGGYITNRYNNLSKKLGHMPEVEYRYLKGENKEITPNKMKKQIKLTEKELKEYIDNEARKFINEMKYDTIYSMVRKSVNEAFDISDDMFAVQHPVDVDAEGVFDFEPDEMNVNSFNKWEKDENYWEDFDKASQSLSNPQFENKLRECIRQVIKEKFNK